jgi:hypothetical protein
VLNHADTSKYADTSILLSLNEAGLKTLISAALVSVYVLSNVSVVVGMNTCVRASPVSCVTCADVDECQATQSPCSDGQYCSNTVGSHVCLRKYFSKHTVYVVNIQYP